MPHDVKDEEKIRCQGCGSMWGTLSIYSINFGNMALLECPVCSEVGSGENG